MQCDRTVCRRVSLYYKRAVKPFLQPPSERIKYVYNLKIQQKQVGVLTPIGRF